MHEIWKEIKDYPKYEVSNKGLVRFKSTKRIIKYEPHYKYLRVQLSNSSGRKHIRVHRLVAEAFVPNPLNKPIVHHKDHNPKNNTAKNLEWCTLEEHKKYHKTYKKL